MKSVFISLLFFLFPYALFANHIAGGELTVQWLSGNEYRITLTLYRDCSNPRAAPFDTPAYIDVWDGAGTTQLPTINIGNPTITNYDPNTNALCLVAPPNICIQIGVYDTTYTFPPRANGYVLAYETCCRNTAILNIPLIKGNGQGAIYTQDIPDSSLAMDHSSPYFNNSPPIVVCAEVPFSFDCSATSPDGDSLAYSLYNPFTAQLRVTSSPPFSLVQFNPGYSWNEPLGTGSPVTFDSLTGQLSFFPSSLGWYVIGLCVREYHNGKLLDVHYRDVEFDIVPCNKSIVANFNTTSSSFSANSFVTCVGNSVNFVNQSTNATNFLWEFGDGTTSTSVNPLHTYNTPGTYVVTLVAQPGVACTDSTQDTVYVFPYPALPKINITSPDCSGKNISFNADSVKGATYSWSGPDNFVSHHQDTSIANAQLSNAGMYTLNIAVNGCSTANSANVNIVQSPAAAVLAAGYDVCDGSNINLSAPTVPGASYSWMGPDSFTSLIQDPVIANAQAADSGIYTCILTVNGCSSPAAGTTVKVIPVANAIIRSNTPLCTGQTLQFKADSASGVVSYNWTGPNNWASALPNPELSNITLADSGIYTVTLNGGNGCSSTYNMRIVVVITPPLPEVLYKSPLCTGDTLSIIVPNTIGGLYYWTGPGNWISNDTNPVFNNVGLADSGIYTIYLSYNGCTGPTKDTDIVVTQTPVAPEMRVNSPICAGATLNLSATSIANGFFDWSYKWSGPDGFSSSLADDSITNTQVVNSGTYKVNVTVNGCASPLSTIDVVVNPIPVSTFKATPTFMCGEGQVMASDPDWISKTATYNWAYTGGALKHAGNDSAIVSYITPGNYILSLQVEDNNCFSSIDSIPIIVAIKPVAVFTADTTAGCKQDTIQFTNLSINGDSYLWNFGNGDTSSLQNPSEIYIANKYTVKLTVTNTDGCSDSSLKSNYITIYPIPVSTFNAMPSFMCGEGQVIATNPGWISPTAIYNWSYPGGILKHVGNDSAVINYLIPGNYNIQLQVEDNNCFSPFDSAPIVVAVKPVATFSADTTIGCAPDTIEFNNLSTNGNTYLWNFGNGDTSSLQSPSSVYTANKYTVKLTVTNTDGCSDSSLKNNYITIYPIPVSTFNAMPSFMCGEGQVIATNPGWISATAIYNWSYTGGTLKHAGNDSAIIDYLTPGNYNIQLQVEDNNCFSPFDSAPIVVAVKPVAAFNADTTLGCAPDTIQFSNLSTNGNTYLWNFGNGDTSSMQSPSAVYAANKYTVKLTVMNTDGCSDSSIKNNYITIYPIPVSAFNATPSFMCGEGQVITADPGWISATAIYNWSYPGGTLKHAGNDSAIIDYLTPGNYNILLLVEDNNCFSPTDSIPLVVGVKPVAAFNADTTIGCGHVTISFKNLSSNGNTYTWNLGNGSSSTAQSPSVIYNPGMYSVELTVVNSDGCSDSVIKDNYINILPTPLAKFSVSPGANVQVLLQKASFTFTNESENATNFLWYFDIPYTDSSTESSPVFMYSDTGNFYPLLVATNEYGCSDTAKVGPLLVELGDNYFVPNTFTPNGDGKNDILYLYGYHVVTATLKIFDRWGAEVFYSDDPIHNGWDGTFKGKQLEAGVYVYSCSIFTVHGQTQYISGSVTLIR